MLLNTLVQGRDSVVKPGGPILSSVFLPLPWAALPDLFAYQAPTADPHPKPSQWGGASHLPMLLRLLPEDWRPAFACEAYQGGGPDETLDTVEHFLVALLFIGLATPTGTGR